MGFLLGIAALIAPFMILEVRPELISGPGDGSLLDHVLDSLRLGFFFYVLALESAADYLRNPALRHRKWVIGWTLAWVGIIVAFAFRPGGAGPFDFRANPFHFVWAIVVPLALAALWLLPSVAAYSREYREKLDREA
ncbi:MAG TPA: hypothetical protein VGR37_07110 [Longimicrobiaceae bacterium]|nr:hypothetical protein [Longimicrobiaceae bacterium]